MPLNPRLDDWTGRSVWLVGASSGIGLALAQQLHALGARVVVSARSAAPLKNFEAAHPGSLALPVDVADAAALHAAAQTVVARHGRLDLVAFCAGIYTPMRADGGFDLALAQQHLQVNYAGALNLLAAVLPPLRQQAQAGCGGHLSLMASVAGYRGLPKALAYGPTKAALINLAEVLYLDLHPLGLGVSVVNPGFVATPLTAQNDFAMPALMTPEAAAQATLKGWARGQFEIHYPRRFTLWLKALQLLGDGAYFAAVRRATGL